MKLSLAQCLSFFVSVACGNELLTSTSEPSPISKAVIDVINKSFLEDVTIINIITAADDDVDDDERLMAQIANEIARNVSSVASVRVNDIHNVYKVRETRFYNVIFLENYQSFRKLNRIIGNELFDFQGFFLLVMTEHKNQYADMEMIFRSMWQHFIINVNILISVSEAELEMFTYYPYTSVYCGRAFPIFTNRFVNASFESSRRHFDDKLKNLFGCPLKVVSFNIPPLVFVERKANGEFRLSGIDGELLNGMMMSVVVGVRLSY